MDVLNILAEPLQFDFMTRAFFAALIVGVVCSVIGSYVVVRGLAFVGDAMAHSIFPGVVLAYLIGVNVLFGALVAGVAAALLIGLLSRRTRLNEQTSIGIVFVGAFALGIALLSSVRSYSVDLTRFLFGNVLGVSSGDLLLTGAVALVVLALLAAFHKEFVFIAFDPAGARSVGLPVSALDYLLLGLLAMAIVISLQTVGTVLVLSMLVTPAATARLFCDRMPPMMVAGAGFGILAAVVGLYLSYYLNVSAGATIVLTSSAFFLVAAVVSPHRRSWWSRRVRREATTSAGEVVTTRG